MDEKEGPYKIVVKPSYAPAMPTYSIAVEQRGGVLKILVPDAGEGQTARDICNLLNKQARETMRWLGLETTDEQAAGTDGAGVPDPDLGGNSA